MEQMKMDGRDSQLDAYRGLVMVYIVCVIRVLYRYALVEPLCSVLLFGMPYFGRRYTA